MLISEIIDIFIMFSEHNDVYFSSSSWGKMSGKCWALPLHLAKPELPGSVVPGSLAASFVLASEQTEGRTDWDRLAELDWTGLDWTGLDWTGLDWTGSDCGEGGLTAGLTAGWRGYNESQTNLLDILAMAGLYTEYIHTLHETVV